MEKPNLAEIVARARSIKDDLSTLDDMLEEAHQAALGVDGPNGEIDESGDDFESFRVAKTKAGDARFALSEIESIMATVEGWRQFESLGLSGEAAA